MTERLKRVAILGSSGSIGRSTLDVVRHWPERFRVVAISAGSNWKVLAEQAREFRPRYVAIAESSAAEQLRQALGGLHGARPEILEGPGAAREIARLPDLDLVVNGLVGSLGLLPTMEALAAGASVALANKEPLVTAGEILMRTARESAGELLPLDSELSAIHQCLRCNPGVAVRKVILTASGGPFRKRAAGEFDSITPEDALEHPTWAMGRKITVDSATLMNKGLEIIETRWYFDMPIERIEVVVHPQSLVHSLVEFADHSVMAQISEPDMRLPIQYALTHPERLPSPVKRLNLVEIGALTFEAPDLARFPCLKLAREAASKGGTAPAVLNAANEEAVQAFLDREIGFREIPAVIEECLQTCAGPPEPTLEDLQHIDEAARAAARRWIDAYAGRERASGHVR